jgi:hypothetical protein
MPFNEESTLNSNKLLVGKAGLPPLVVMDADYSSSGSASVLSMSDSSFATGANECEAPK